MTECFPLSWPEGWPRTPIDKQDRGWQFKRKGTSDYGWRDQLITFATGRDSLYDELRRLGATQPVVTTNHPTDRSLALAIEALRQLERHGGGTMIERAFTGFTALPSPKDPRVILGVRPGATAEEIDAAFRENAKRAHPEAGGSTAMMTELNEARRKLKERAA